MKRVLGLGGAAMLAAAALASCSGSGPAAPKLAGKWTGKITCYKMESPLQVVIDGAGKATVTTGGGGNWPATASYDSASNKVTIKADDPNDQAAIIAGVLSKDGATLAGTMEHQLCTDVELARRAG